MGRKIIAPLAALALMATACGGGNSDTAIAPRQPAYPRVAAYDTVYAPVAAGPLVLQTNAQASTQLSQADDGSASQWLTIEYPRYRAAVYITVTPTASQEQAAQIIDNRLERIALNAGGSKTATTEVANVDDIFATLYQTPEARTTPLQFIAVAADAVLSGTVFMRDISDAAPLDSLAPTVDALRADITHLLRTAKYQ